VTGAVLTRPRALVVVESMFGNTAAVAAALAQGLAEETSVEVVPAASAPPLDEEIDLVVVGAPTHLFSMPRPVTREDARQQGALAVEPSRGLREWIAELPAGPHHPRVVTFDTRMTRTRRMPGSAARASAGDLRAKGFAPLATSTSFHVDDVLGPLAEGELDRARAWGTRMGSVLTAVTASPAAGR
jgi:hypothetical protein